MTDWRTDIENAPKDRPILGWCKHDADPYVEDEAAGRLTLYAAHYEGMSHCEDGPHVLEWGGAWDDTSYEDFGQAGHLPDWWFVTGTECEVAANPILWAEITEPSL